MANLRTDDDPTAKVAIVFKRHLVGKFIFISLDSIDNETTVANIPILVVSTIIAVTSEIIIRG